MKNARKSLILLLLAGLLLASCAGQAAGEPTPDISASLTAGVGTIVAYFFQTQTALAPTATVTPSITPLPSPSGSPVALPTIGGGGVASPTQYLIFPTVTPTGTIYTPTTNPGSLAYGCNNLLFIRDVDTPNGTWVKPGEKFTRTWKVANNGTCDWLFGFQLVPVSGSKLAQDPIAVHNAPVKPNEWREFSKNVTAPTEPGTYTQYWQLSDGAGHTFGSLLSISINVGTPTQTPTTKPSKTPVTPSATTVPNTATITSTVTPTDTSTPTP